MPRSGRAEPVGELLAQAGVERCADRPGATGAVDEDPTRTSSGEPGPVEGLRCAARPGPR